MPSKRSLLLLAVGMAAAVPWSGPASAARHRHTVPVAHNQAPQFNQAVLNAEVLLDRAGFSSGTIDGRDGDNFGNALHAFQQVNGLPVGRLDEQQLERLAQVANAPAVTEYTIQPGDVEGPFTPQIPQDFQQMAQLPRVAYHSPQQLLAAKFHMSEALLSALNSGKNFGQAGTVITVANVAPMPADPKLAARSGEGSGSSTQQQPKAAKVVVDKRNHAVLAYGPDSRVLAFFPASIGSTEKPAPSGTFEVRSVAYDPDYTYNPAYGFKGQKAERPVRVAPGPNNPVGMVWIGLSAKGFGIHGTPDPDKIGKTQSHGCVRLTNWDALALAKLVKRGTSVAFVD
jgi:lipoprotein-anchoring transpeptidase ErfK/SrfK